MGRPFARCLYRHGVFETTVKEVCEMGYAEFILSKSQGKVGSGFAFNGHDFLFPFQRYVVEWSCRMARSAIFADCGLGKTAMQLSWADAVYKHTGRPVLILTPLAVARQTEVEAGRFNIDAATSFDGSLPSGVTITNYEQLHKFSRHDVSGVVADESSIIKHFGGATQKQLTRFMQNLQFRLLCTATAAPNDWVELGTSSEAIGELSDSDMKKRFFKQLDDKGQKKEQRLQDEAEKLQHHDAEYFGKLAFRVAQTIGQWRLKHYAIDDFWRWVSSWARAMRKPSDLGFSDNGYNLPKLNYVDHVVKSQVTQPGRLFNVPAYGLGEEREERKRTLRERCERVADLVAHNDFSVIWCHTNAEGDTLESIIPGAEQIAGRTPDEKKIELYEAFAAGQLKKLVIKPKIGAWGLNWQHCNHVVTFASHSYEQTYQSVRRCYRFGQTREVTVDTVATEGESRVIDNMRRKATQAETMFQKMILAMNDSLRIERQNVYTNRIEVPSWLSSVK